MFGSKRKNVELEGQIREDQRILKRYMRGYKEYFDEKVTSKKLYEISMSGRNRSIFVDEIPSYGGIEQVVPYTTYRYGPPEYILELSRQYGYVFKVYPYLVKSEPVLLNTTQIQTIESKEVNVAEMYIGSKPDFEWVERRYEE